MAARDVIASAGGGKGGCVVTAGERTGSAGSVSAAGAGGTVAGSGSVAAGASIAAAGGGRTRLDTLRGQCAAVTDSSTSCCKGPS